MYKFIGLVIWLFILLIPVTDAAEVGPGAKEAKLARTEALAQRDVQKGAMSSARLEYDGPRLDLVIPLLDPGLPADQSSWEAKGIQPELRRAEAVWFAKKMAEALDETGVFNSVLVVPDGSVSADFYLMGKINESNGEDFKLGFTLYDATGRKVRTKGKKGKKGKKQGLNLKVRVSPLFYLDPATKDMEPLGLHYKDLARNIAEQVIAINTKDKKLAKKNEKHRAKGKFKKIKPLALENIVSTRRAVFATDLSPEEFPDVLSERKGVYKLLYTPDFEQDNWQRVSSIIEVDQQFNRLMDQNYKTLAEDMNVTYRTYLRDAYTISSQARKDREARNAAIAGAIFGALAAGAMASNSSSSAGQTAAAAMAVASAAAAITAIKQSSQYQEQKELLNELGASVAASLSPRVIEMEGREVQLSGTATEQQAQWRTLMQELYDEGISDIGAIEVIEVL